MAESYRCTGANMHAESSARGIGGTPQREPETFMACACLESDITELLEAVATLNSRLTPISRDVGEAVKSVSSLPEFNSQLACRLATSIQKVRMLYSDVMSMIARLEV